MPSKPTCLLALLALMVVAASSASATPISIYGAWHCGNDACTWAAVRNMSDFDNANHWLVDRGDGSGLPSVNLVVLSFVNPLKLLNQTSDAGTAQGVPVGMNAAVVDYFKTKGVRVMLSIGGITFVDDWNTALATNATQLGINAARVAHRLGVGIEIDYEENTNPNLAGLQAFIDAYRSYVDPVDGLDTRYDPTGNNPAARLTIDLGAGDRFLIALCRKATTDWLTASRPVLDYANAMVPNRQPSASGAQDNWQEHVDGKPQFAPPIPPLAPAKFTGALYIVTGRRAAPECASFGQSLTRSTGNYVQTVVPAGAGTTAGMLGFMFWAAECPSGRRVCTVPPDTCEGGVGVGATTYGIPVPMPALRQN